MPTSIVGSHVIIKIRKTHELVATGLVIDKTGNILTVRTFNAIFAMDYDVEMSIKSFSDEFYLCRGHVVAIDNKTLMISNVEITSENDRRRAERVEFKSDIILVSSFIRDDLTGKMKNISESGFLFKTDASLPHSDKLMLQLPIINKNKIDIIAAEAKIVRSSNSYYGCAFTDIETYHKDKIRKIVAERSFRTEFFKKRIS